MACDSIFAHGAVIVPDFVTAAEEERLLLRIGQAPWMTELSRPVQHYGYRYDYRGASRPEPAALPVQCIVNEYCPGQGIGMHADHRDFGPVVASLSLATDWPMRFRRRDAGRYVRGGLPGDEVAVLPRRSVLVLAGIARRDWMHGINPADTARGTATRVSATFRTLASGPGRP